MHMHAEVLHVLPCHVIAGKWRGIKADPCTERLWFWGWAWRTVSGKVSLGPATLYMRDKAFQMNTWITSTDSMCVCVCVRERKRGRPLEFDVNYKTVVCRYLNFTMTVSVYKSFCVIYWSLIRNVDTAKWEHQTQSHKSHFFRLSYWLCVCVCVCVPAHAQKFIVLIVLHERVHHYYITEWFTKKNFWTTHLRCY